MNRSGQGRRGSAGLGHSGPGRATAGTSAVRVRTCARRGPRGRRGLTLVEVVVALAVVALAAAAVVAAMGGAGAGARQRAAVDGIVASLSRARLLAMQRQQRVEARLEPSLAQGVGDEETGWLALTIGGESRRWSRTGLVPAPGAEEAIADGGVRREARASAPEIEEASHLGRAGPLRVVFDSAGRADRALWRLAEAGAAAGSGASVPGGAAGRTLWLIRFDVVSGVPTAERVRVKP